jgi:hypothetical protein
VTEKLDGATVSVVHEVARTVRMSACDVELLNYDYAPDVRESECRAPHFHPLRDLSGAVVTGHRPHDHRWHKGLAMTASHLSGQNFWGGGSYVHGQGYVDLPNVGSLRHRGFPAFAEDGAPGFTEEVDWVTAAGEHWIAERRAVCVREVDVAAGSWVLEFGTALRNVRGTALEFASPTVFGRELAGYCGFFWRGPRSFTGGEVLASGGQRGPELMGRAADWLAFVGTHDGIDHRSTVAFLPDPSIVDESLRWFVRTEPIPVMNPSLAFWEPRELAAGDTLRLRYRVLIADTAWDADRIEHAKGAQQW